MTMMHLKRSGMIAAVAGLAMLLTACLLTPGKFISNLDIRKDGTFSFTYKGEITVLGMTKLAQMDKQNAATPFEAEDCFDKKDNVRTCTAAELEEQKANWEQAQKDRADKAKRDAEEMKPFMGGIDPTDPKAAEELAERMRKQVGWNTVTYKGDGLYEVDYAITGKLTQDYVFPVIERFPVPNAFVSITRRKDGTLRVEAPAFAPASNGGPFGDMMKGAAAADAKNGENKEMPDQPALDGQFTLTTNAQILANNTDDGPAADPAGQRLSWKVNVRSAAAPMALIKLAN